MDKGGTQKVGLKAKEIDNNAQGLTSKKWQSQTMCQEKEKEED